MRWSSARGSRSSSVGFGWHQGFGQSQTSLPLSKMMRQVPGASRRQIDVKVAKSLPCGSRTGPLDSARLPESSTSTVSGCHENGARRAFVEPLPEIGDLALAAQRLGRREEDGLVGQERRECGEVAVGHRLRKRALGVGHLALQVGRRAWGVIGAQPASTPRRARPGGIAWTTAVATFPAVGANGASFRSASHQCRSSPQSWHHCIMVADVADHQRLVGLDAARSAQSSGPPRDEAEAPRSRKGPEDCAPSPPRTAS